MKEPRLKERRCSANSTAFSLRHPLRPRCSLCELNCFLSTRKNTSCRQTSDRFQPVLPHPTASERIQGADETPGNEDGERQGDPRRTSSRETSRRCFAAGYNVKDARLESDFNRLLHMNLFRMFTLPRLSQDRIVLLEATSLRFRGHRAPRMPLGLSGLSEPERERTSATPLPDRTIECERALRKKLDR
jgi:hypothetical protein